MDIERYSEPGFKSVLRPGIRLEYYLPLLE